MSWWGNVLPQTYVLLKLTSLAFLLVLFSDDFSRLVFFSSPPLSFIPILPFSSLLPSFNPSLLPSCSSVSLQGGRQVTAVGGRRACRMLLCLGLHQNIPPQVTLATAVPFNHPTVVWRKWQHTSSGQYSPVTTQKVTLTFNFSPLGMIHDLLSYTGPSMFIFDFEKS